MYIRPHIEYAQPVWRPHLQKDIYILNRVQHAVSRWPKTFSLKPYNDRLKLLKIPPLEDRQDRGDLIQMYRLTHKIFPENSSNFLTLAEDRRLRGHCYKLKKEHFKSTYRQNFLVNRAFTQWNSLSANVVEESSVCQFKKSLDRFQYNK